MAFNVVRWYESLFFTAEKISVKKNFHALRIQFIFHFTGLPYPIPLVRVGLRCAAQLQLK